MSHRNFTPSQQKAIDFFPTDPVRKHLVIEAGAGSGKTTILQARVKFLLTEKKFLPEDLIVITFTKNATSELKHRIERIGATKALEAKTKFIQISTMDSFFISLVESVYPVWWDLNQSLSDKIPSKLTLLSESQALVQVEKNLIKGFDEFSNDELREISDFILAGGFEKNEGLIGGSSPLHTLLLTMLNDGFLSTSLKDIRISAKQIHPATQKLIEKCHHIARFSYQERIVAGTLTYQDYNVFLKENLNISCPLHFKELIVDEYQDTNHIQHQILWKLVELNHAQMTVVGDPKQSIYAFRGSHVDVFHSLLNNEKWNVISLDVNFRSTEYLLNELNTLSFLAFDWKTPALPESFIESFFYKEALKKAIAHKPLKAGMLADSNQQVPQVTLFEYEDPNSAKKLKDDPPKKRDFNEKNLKSLGTYLLKKKRKNNLNWKDIAVLCEKNSQITKIKKIFSELNIPCSVDSQKQNKLQKKYNQILSLTLLKVLEVNTIDISFELVNLLASPLTPHTLSDITQYALNQNIAEPCIVDATIQIIKDAQTKYKFHPFIAWQTCRWNLAYQAKTLTGKDDALLFAASMDLFAKSFLDIFNSGCRKDLIKILSTFDTSTLSTKSHTEDAISIKTVHGSKGLEWDIVCFYPANSRADKRESFSVSSSWPYLDVNWLSEDVKSLSFLQKKDNEKFEDIDHIYDDKKDKTIWFSDLRASLEKNFERQRIFYTAFTRPRQELIFVHPERQGATSARKIDKKFHFADYDKSFEQDVFLKYAHLSEHNKANALHLRSSEIEIPYANDNESKVESTDKPLVFQNIEINSLEETEPEFSNLQELISTPSSILVQKQRIRQAAHKGIIFHAQAENKIYSKDSILELLFDNALKTWSEFEILNKISNHESTPITRKVIDLLAVFTKEKFGELFHRLSHSSNYLNWNIKTDSNFVFLILDFKTGKITESGVDQISEYVSLIENLAQSGWFAKSIALDSNPNIVSTLLHSSRNTSRFPNSAHVSIE